MLTDLSMPGIGGRQPVGSLPPVAALAELHHGGASVALFYLDLDQSKPVLTRLRSTGIGYAQGRAVAAPEPLTDGGGEMVFPCLQQLM